MNKTPFLIKVVGNGVGRYNAIDLPLKDAFTKNEVFPKINENLFAITDSICYYIFTEHVEPISKTISATANGVTTLFDVDTKGSLVNLRTEDANTGNEYAKLLIKLYDIRGLVGEYEINRYYENGSCYYFDSIFDSPYYEKRLNPEKPNLEDVPIGGFYPYHIFNGINRDNFGNYVNNTITFYMWFRASTYYYWLTNRLYGAIATFGNDIPFEPDYINRWCGRMRLLSTGISWLDVYEEGQQHLSSPFHGDSCYIDVYGLGNSICHL